MSMRCAVVVVAVVAVLTFATTALAVSSDQLFFEVRTDLSNDEGNLSFYSMSITNPSAAPVLVKTFANVPGGRANFGIDPVRNFMYFDMYMHFDKGHEGLFFGRFNLSTPDHLEHLDERVDAEPGGLRVAPGSRIGETFFTSCIDDPVSEDHSLIQLFVFDNGDLDVRKVAAFSPDMLDSKACNIPIAYSNEPASTLFIGASNSSGGVVYVIPRNLPAKKYPVSVPSTVLGLAYLNNSAYALTCETTLRLYSIKATPQAAAEYVMSIPGECGETMYVWQMAADPLVDDIFIVAANQSSILRVNPTARTVAPLTHLTLPGRLQGVQLPWWGSSPSTKRVFVDPAHV